MRRIPLISIFLVVVASAAAAGGIGKFDPVIPSGYGPGANLMVGVPVCGLIGVFIDALIFWVAAGFKRDKVLWAALLSQAAVILAWAIGHELSANENSTYMIASTPFVALGIQLLANYFIIGDYLKFQNERLYITIPVCIALGNIPFLALSLLDSIGRYGMHM